MRKLSASQILFIIARRLEKRADILEIAGQGFAPTVFELRQFAAMVKRARDYLNYQWR